MNTKSTQLFNSKGFTLIELLAVMVIILIIAGMFVGVSGPASQSAKKRKAEVMVSALEVAIGMYKADTGSYPPTDSGTGCTNLYDGLTNLNHGVVGNAVYVVGWGGPYMQFKNEDLDAAKTYIIDPWSHPYRYRMPGTANNTNSFELWSMGPDGVEGDSAKDKDNPNNW